MKEFVRAIKVFIVFSFFLGIVYPLLITAIAQRTMPVKANGSLVHVNGVVAGSSLIAQDFGKPTYFHSRPSAVDYNGAGSGGSNLGPSSKKLMAQVTQRLEQARKDNALPKNNLIPADMVLTSASGLDRNISIENAMLQASRVARYRNIPLAAIKTLIYKHVEPDFIGIWGQKGVNVLLLNLAMDSI